MKKEALEQRCAEMRARQQGQTVEQPAGAHVTQMRFMEKHYTVADCAAFWAVSPDTIRRIFTNEPGVVDMSSNADRSGKYKKRQKLLLIPESVLIRVYNRRRNPAA